MSNGKQGNDFKTQLCLVVPPCCFNWRQFLHFLSEDKSSSSWVLKSSRAKSSIYHFFKDWTLFCTWYHPSWSAQIFIQINVVCCQQSFLASCTRLMESNTYCCSLIQLPLYFWKGTQITSFSSVVFVTLVQLCCIFIVFMLCNFDAVWFIHRDLNAMALYWMPSVCIYVYKKFERHILH